MRKGLIVLASLLAAAFSWALESALLASPRPAGVAAPRPLLPAGKLDLPLLEPVYVREPDITIIPSSACSYGEGGGLTSAIDSWGSRYLSKKWLEESLRSGPTLPAPLLQRGDLQLYMLFPWDGLRLDLRALPVGALFRFGLLRGAPSKGAQPFQPLRESN